MVPAVEAEATRAPVEQPERKRKLTVAQAASIYVSTTHAIEGLERLRKDAKEVLLAHFERTGRGSYKDLVGWRWTGGGLILDQAKVREFLGDRLADFQTRSKRSRALQLLKPAE